MTWIQATEETSDRFLKKSKETDMKKFKPFLLYFQSTSSSLPLVHVLNMIWVIRDIGEVSIFSLQSSTRTKFWTNLSGKEMSTKRFIHHASSVLHDKMVHVSYPWLPLSPSSCWGWLGRGRWGGDVETSPLNQSSNIPKKITMKHTTTMVIPSEIISRSDIMTTDWFRGNSEVTTRHQRFEECEWVTTRR